MKKLSSIKGAKVLDKKAQKFVNGGKAPICNAPFQAVYNPITGAWICCLSD